jgi:hypothetical protein
MTHDMFDSTPFGITVELETAVSALSRAIKESRSLSLPTTDLMNVCDELISEIDRVRRTVVISRATDRRSGTYRWHCGCGTNRHGYVSLSPCKGEATVHIRNAHNSVGHIVEVS